MKRSPKKGVKNKRKTLHHWVTLIYINGKYRIVAEGLTRNK